MKLLLCSISCGFGVRVPLLKRQPGSCVFNPYSLSIYECMCSEVRKLSAVATVLHSANGDPRIRCRDPIVKDATGVQIAGNLACSIYVSCPKVAAESELACVRRCNSRFM